MSKDPFPLPEFFFESREIDAKRPYTRELVRSLVRKLRIDLRLIAPDLPLTWLPRR